MREDNSGIWAYAICRHVGDTDLSWLRGVAGATVRPVAGAGLAMLVSDVPLAEFGEAALRRNLENLAWLDEVARAHHRVIAAATRLFPLLPTRLATVYSSDAAAAAALVARSCELHNALLRVAGRVEWGVKAYAVQDARRTEQVPVGARRAAGGGQEAWHAGGGMAYLKRRREELSASRDSRAAAVAAARSVHAALAGHCQLSQLHPPQSPELDGTRLPMLLNAAYLTDASDGRGFREVVAALATAHPQLRLELTGPWPPYSFAGAGG